MEAVFLSSNHAYDTAQCNDPEEYDVNNNRQESLNT